MSLKGRFQCLEAEMEALANKETLSKADIVKILKFYADEWKNLQQEMSRLRRDSQLHPLNIL